jgi:hypothetical protein
LVEVGPPVTMAAIVLLNCVCLLMSLPAAFPSDVRRPEPPRQALTGFFRDCRHVLRQPATRWSLLAVASLRGLALVSAGAFLIDYMNRDPHPREVILTLIGIALVSMLGAAGGSLLAGWQAHPTRMLGLVPFGTVGLCLALVWAAAAPPVPLGLCLVVGALGGLANVPLLSFYQAHVPADARGNGMAFLNTAGYLAMTGLSLAVAALSRVGLLSATGQLWFAAALAAVVAVSACWALRRDCGEQVLELLLWPFCRVRGHGPGVAQMPRTGPVLVVVNEVGRLGPVCLAKVLPRRLTPALPENYLSGSLLTVLAARLVRAVRAADTGGALAALDRGEAVLLLPVSPSAWEVLKERPQTPVVVCWIEDRDEESATVSPATRRGRRRFEVVVAAPRLLDAAVLADPQATAACLGEEGLDARRRVGLAPRQEPVAAGAARQE